MNFIVLGFRRSGTTYISELIKTHPNAKCLIEPLTLNIDNFRQHEFSYWTDKDFVQTIYHSSFRNKQLAVEFLTEFKKWLDVSSDRNAIGFKEVTLHSKILWLKKFIPDIKIIYLTRDPKNVVASFKKLNFSQRWDYKNKVRRFINQKQAPFSIQGLPLLINDTNYSENDIVVSCLAFKISILYYLHIADRGALMRVKIEDFLDAPRNITSDIMNYIGLEIHRRQVEFINETTSTTRGGSYSKYRRKDDVNNLFQILTPSEFEIIEELLADEKRLLGYG